MSITPFVLSAATTESTGEGLDLSSIKEIMDAFDPATLLPDLETLTGKVELVARIAVLAGPILLLVLGLAYLFLAPREANYRFGYRTWFGMGSVEAWRFTQRIAGLVFGLAGLVLTIVMFLTVRGFSSMDIMDMMDKAVTCLIWEIFTALAGCLIINLLAMLSFDSMGNPRASGARPSGSRSGRSRPAKAPEVPAEPLPEDVEFEFPVETDAQLPQPDDEAFYGQSD